MSVFGKTRKESVSHVPKGLTNDSPAIHLSEAEDLMSLSFWKSAEVKQRTTLLFLLLFITLYLKLVDSLFISEILQIILHCCFFSHLSDSTISDELPHFS